MRGRGTTPTAFRLPSFRRGPNNGHGRARVARRVTTPRPLCAGWPAQGIGHAQRLKRGCGHSARCVRTDSVGSPRAEVDGAEWRARSRRWSRALSLVAIIARSAIIARRVSQWAGTTPAASLRRAGRQPTGGNGEGDAARAAPAASPRRAQQLPTGVAEMDAASTTPPHSHVCSFRHVKRFLVTDTSQIVTHSLPLSGTVFGDSEFSP